MAGETIQSTKRVLAPNKRRSEVLCGLIILGVGLAGGHALAQVSTNAPISTTTNTAPALRTAAEEKIWAFSLSAYTYLLPNGHDYVQPTFTADRDWLHLEARYNYEDLDTGSAWVGYNFSGGKRLAWEFTPMLGGVLGDTTGIAPGYKGSLSWWNKDKPTFVVAVTLAF